MNKLTLIVISCLALHLSFAQQQIYKIDFKLQLGTAAKERADQLIGEIEGLEPLGPAVAGSQPFMEAWVSQTKHRVKTNILEENEFITDQKKGITYVLYHPLKQYVMVHSENRSNDDAVSEAQSVEEPYFNIEYIPDSSRTIAGYPCKLAVLDIDIGEYNANLLGEAPLMKVWYSEMIPAFDWREYPYLQALPGAALALSVAGIGYQASAVTPLPFEEHPFELPEGYTELKAVRMEYEDE